MDNKLEQMNADLERIALRVVTLETGDIPAMGEILNTLTALEATAATLDAGAFQELTRAMRGYLERIILNETSDLAPMETGVTTLQEMWRALSSETAYRGDLNGLLTQLGVASAVTKASEAIEPEDIKPAADPASPRGKLTEEDIQILGDFVVESLENLESIEINLIDLEQDPHNTETINAIFRPFHTIKGVSGFLNLKTINRMSHSTENLLDSARQGEIRITDEIIDIVLESVDTLKKLIHQVEQSLASGTQSLEAAIDIEPLVQRIADTATKTRESAKPIGEILVEKGAVKSEDLEKGLQIQRARPEKRLGKILVDERMTDSKEVITALREQKRGPKITELQVKVDTIKLDNLVDLTGELVIAQSMLRQNTKIMALNDQRAYQSLNQLTQIVSGLQKIAMSMRMVPIKSTFQKMVRLVRDLARNSGKEVDLEMIGEDTEIDRNVVDELYEPMVHMIRNAVDHGLELPAEREAVGKNRRGTIELRAYHKGGNIIIEIADNGRGLDKKRIFDKAVSSGLIRADAQLSDSEIHNLIFLPGFSTAKAVTDISGRGVGMDVVKRGVEKIRGHLDIQSVQGDGSTFVIALPLTLAIIEGMVIRVGRQRYILPTMAILKSFKPTHSDYFTVEGKGEMVMARGKLIPLIRFDRVFGVAADAKAPWDGLVVVVENKGEQKGLLIDELLGQEEIVIKSLGESLKDTKGMAGGAILGDGRVGLILDVAGLFEISLKP
jgi:two-component system chemotaxis sensor kinase CheA